MILCLGCVLNIILFPNNAPTALNEEQKTSARAFYHASINIVLHGFRCQSSKREPREVGENSSSSIKGGVLEMARSQEENSHEIIQAQGHVWNNMFQFVNSMSLRCAVQLGIPDTIHSHGQPMTLSQLVAALPINPAKALHLGRLMRLLVHSGFFAAQKMDGGDGEEGYVLTPPSKLLLTGPGTSLSPFLLMMLDPVFVTPCQLLSTWFIGSDSTAFQTANGASLWELASQNSELNCRFNEAMASDARLTMSIVVKDHGLVFQGLRSLLDVGGGTGIAAEAIASAFPHVKCSVFDLPHVVATAPERNNVRMIGGDMFQSIPSVHAVFLKWILHDWSDQECVKILKNCREAIPSRKEGGKVIILDMVVNKDINGDHKALETQLFSDLLVLAYYGGKERAEKEWRKIFIDAGFTDYKITSISGLRSIIEVYP